MKLTPVDIDPAKSVFQVYGIDMPSKVLVKKHDRLTSQLTQPLMYRFFYLSAAWHLVAMANVFLHYQVSRLINQPNFSA